MNKRTRLNSIEIEYAATEAWNTVLKQDSDIKLLQQYDIEFNETIQIVNPIYHQEFNASHLDLSSRKPIICQSIDVEFTDSSSESSCEDIVIPEKSFNFEHKSEKLKPSEFYKNFVVRSEVQCKEESEAPQKSTKWLEARSLCITASQFGAAIGESPYQTPDELVNEKLWNTFVGNSATKWGNDHECHAKESFIEWFNLFLQKNNGSHFVFREENLMKFSKEPWMAVSPDGIITYTINGVEHTDLIEFKCPAYLRNTKHHPYSKFNLNTPPHYLAQIQGIMGYLNNYGNYSINKCWFVVWQPHQTWITLHEYRNDYYLNLFEKLHEWYFTKLLPAFTHRHNNMLIHGTSFPQEPILLTKE